ncbi:isochorismatase family protein [Paracoccus nototheniae]
MPEHIFEKCVYSPWGHGDLERTLRARGVNALVISDAETDICVMATASGAVDRGFRIIVATDGLCSSSDLTHDAILTLLRTRLGQQIETDSAA